MEQKNVNNEVIEAEAKEVVAVIPENKTEEVTGLIPKAKAWFKKNGKKIVKVAAIGGAVLGAGYVLGKRSNDGQSEVIDIPAEDITECDVSDIENIG